MRNILVIALSLFSVVSFGQTLQDTVKVQPLSEFPEISLVSGDGTVIPVQFIRNDSSLWGRVDKDDLKTFILANIGAIGDVLITSPTDSSILIYDQANSRWIDAPYPSISGGSGVSDGVITGASYNAGTQNIDVTVASPGTSFSFSVAGLLDNTDTQDLTLVSNTLSLTDGGSVDLSGYLDNTDSQDLSLTGNTLSLSGDATPVDLSGYLDNTDDQTITTFTLSGTQLLLAIENGPGTYTTSLGSLLQDANEVPVTPTGNLASTDVQAALVELQTDIDGIGGGGTDDQTAAEVPVTPVGNLNSTNVQAALEEHQADIDAIASGAGDGVATAGAYNAGTGNIDITVAAPGSSFSFDVSALEPLTESEVDAFVANNGYLTAEVDGSITNEIQDLSLAGTTLSLTGDATTVDLSVIQDGTGTDDQVIDVFAFDGTNLTLSLEGDGEATKSIDLSALLDNTDTQLTQDQVQDFAGLLFGTDTESLISTSYDNTTNVITFTVDNNLDNYDNSISQFLKTEVDGSITNEANTGVTWDDVTNTLSVTDPNGTVSAIITGYLEEITGTELVFDAWDKDASDDLVDADFGTAGLMATDGAGTYSIVTDNSSNWNTAYSWGDHAAQGYLTTEVDGSITNEIQDLQSVTDQGATTTNAVNFARTIKVGDNQLDLANGSIEIESTGGPSTYLTQSNNYLTFTPDPGGNSQGFVNFSNQVGKTATDVQILNGGNFKLNHVVGSNNGGKFIVDGGSTSNGASLHMTVNNAYPTISTSHYGSTGTARDLRFDMEYVTKMVLDVDGNLGVNVLDPQYRLDVDGTVRLQNISDGSSFDQILAYNSTTGEVGYTTDQIGTDNQQIFFNSETNILSIESANNVDLSPLAAGGGLSWDDQTEVLYAEALTIPATTFTDPTYANSRNFHAVLNTLNLSNATLELPTPSATYEKYYIAVTCIDGGTGFCRVTNTGTAASPVTKTMSNNDRAYLLCHKIDDIGTYAWTMTETFAALPESQTLSWSAGTDRNDEITLSDGGGTITVTDDQQLSWNSLTNVLSLTNSATADLNDLLQGIIVSGNSVVIQGGPAGANALPIVNTVESVTSGSTTAAVDLEGAYNRIAQIDMTSAGPAVTLSVSNPVTGGVYTFHFQSVSSTDLAFPGTFLDAAGSTLGTVSMAADNWYTCYYDGSNYHCK